MILNKFEQKIMDKAKHAALEEKKYIDEGNVNRSEYWHGIIKSHLDDLVAYRSSLSLYFKHVLKTYTQLHCRSSFSWLFNLRDSPMSAKEWYNFDRTEKYLAPQMWGNMKKEYEAKRKTPDLDNIKKYSFHRGMALESWLTLLRHNPRKKGYFYRLESDCYMDILAEAGARKDGNYFYRDY